MFVMSFITLLQGKGILLFPCFFKEKAYVTYRPDAQRVAFYGILRLMQIFEVKVLVKKH